MNYAQGLDYLKGLQRFGIKLGLENIRTLLASLDDPQKNYPSVLIAGTNGKGSVAAMLARILSGHDFRTGLYTSPHLMRIEERVRINERPISRARFCRGLNVIQKKVDGLLASGRLEKPPTFFEVITALALAEFAERNVDLAVLEVGMGGRFDATNAVTPVVSVITTISKDHEKYLGRTLRAIAFEKAGIIKKGIPVVCGVKRGEAFRVIRKRAGELKAPFIEVFGPGVEFESWPTKEGYRFRYTDSLASYSYRPSLQGLHQGENAAIALRASEVLGSAWKPLDKEKAIQAVESTRWEGRLERVSRRPPVILDGAHNPEGAASLRRYIQDILGGPVIIIFNAMKDKDIRKMADLLFPLARRIVLTQIRMPRAASPEDVAALCPAFRDKMILQADVEKALRTALKEAKGRTPVIAAGSLFLVGEIKKLQVAFSSQKC